MKKTRYIKTDILIIGGGAAGCMAAIFAKKKAPHLDVTILEKAHVRRSGCLAKGLNAVNACLVDSTPDEYLKYVKNDNFDIVRSDLIFSIGERLNRMTKLIEDLGVPMHKNDRGGYENRSPRSILMDGEHLKPLLSEAVMSCGVKVYNRTPVYRLLKSRGGEAVIGAAGFNVRTLEPVVSEARAVLICTGGASGIYHPSNAGLERTKTWYCPYNAGAGLAMGLRAGAEMTSFEMRFVALRTKDIVAPTGTLVLGRDVRQCNSKGEVFLERAEKEMGRSLNTSERLFYTVKEQKNGKGPCYIDISRLGSEEYTSLIKSYLNMSPSIILELLGEHNNKRTSIEICGSEPYINGGHGMAGFWIDAKRRTTLKGLYAAGDVAGGAPKKYLTGCFAEAEIAIEDILCGWIDFSLPAGSETEHSGAIETLFTPICSENGNSFIDVEERLHKIMEEYAGGCTQNYEMDHDKLVLAKKYLNVLSEKIHHMKAGDGHELMRVQDTIDRILLARTLLEHMDMRKETRWPCYHTRLDYPERNDDSFRVFINSRIIDNKISVFKRRLNDPYELI